MDYTHYRYVIRNIKTGEVTRTIVVKNGESVTRLLRTGEKLGEKIGGMNLSNQK